MVAPRIAVALLLLAGTALAQDLSDVQRYLLSASRLYQGLEYERALEQLKRAKSVAVGVSDDAVIDRYEGIVLFDLGKREEALAAFKEALLLEPDGVLPIKVSPKITEAFEATRVKVKKELEPILALRRAETAARKEAAERERVARLEAERAETARKEASEREAVARAAAEEARRRADEAQKQKLADLKRREEAALAAEAKLAAMRKALAEDEKRVAERRVEAATQAARLAEFDAAHRIDDRPTKQTLMPEPKLDDPPLVVKARPTPVAPLVFGGVTLAAGGVATAFGIMANQQLAAARAATFQSDTNAALQRAQTDALVTNIAIGVAGAAAITTLVTLITAAP